jgi:hypothetical protein
MRWGHGREIRGRGVAIFWSRNGASGALKIEAHRSASLNESGLASWRASRVARHAGRQTRKTPPSGRGKPRGRPRPGEAWVTGSEPTEVFLIRFYFFFERDPYYRGFPYLKLTERTLDSLDVVEIFFFLYTKRNTHCCAFDTPRLAA